MFDATPFLSLYARYRRSQLVNQNPAKTQERQLLRLLNLAAQTKFGRDHGFGEIRSVAEYQKRVPLRTYDQIWEQYLKPVFPNVTDVIWPGKIPCFAVSSGTSSGRTKYLPITAQMTASNRKAGLDLLTHHLANRPGSRIFGGKSFILGGSTDLVDAAPGVTTGDLSGIAVKTLPWWAAARYFPPPELALLKNWEEKIETLAQRSLQEEIRMVSGVPSWLLIFFKRMWEIRPESNGSLRGIYPNLEMLVHGGVNFAPYLKQFQGILADTKAELREVYPASEGFIAIADRGSGDGLRMNLDHGIFFEFVPLEELQSAQPTRHWIGNVQTGVNYAIVLTTCAGLWSYIIGDTVKFVDTATPRILVTGRTSYYLSAFGEHLTGDEVEDAVSTAAQQFGLTLADYSVGALYPTSPAELGGHLVVAEFEGRQPTAAELPGLSAAIEKRLSERNEDYEAHRASGFGLRAPEVQVVPSGHFAKWMKSRGKLGGQHKVPRIITDQELFASLRTAGTPQLS